jgi:ferredoxin
MSEETVFRIEINRELCMGSGVCSAYASNTFEVDDETKAIVVNSAGNGPGEIEAAAEGCPTGAIRLINLSSASG